MALAKFNGIGYPTIARLFEFDESPEQHLFSAAGKTVELTQLLELLTETSLLFGAHQLILNFELT